MKNFKLKSNIVMMMTALVISGIAYSSESHDLSSDKQNITESDLQSNETKWFVNFKPPNGWRIANSKDLPSSVKIMVVGQGSYDFPPSINLGTEKFDGTLNKYLKTIREINRTQGAELKDLGTLQTKAGNASLSQVDAKTEWGDVRMMHVILLRNNIVYILTVAALKEEFPKFYKEFFRSMRSLTLSNDPVDLLTSSQEKKMYYTEKKKLKKRFKELAVSKNISLKNDDETLNHFDSQEFKNQYGIPYIAKIENEFASYGQEWKTQVLNDLKKDLIHNKKSLSKNQSR